VLYRVVQCAQQALAARDVPQHPRRETAQQSMPSLRAVMRAAARPPLLRAHLRLSSAQPFRAFGAAAVCPTAPPPPPPPPLSYLHGTGSPLLSQTLGAALSSAAARWPSRRALVAPWQGVQWSWSELDARVDDCAAGLLRHASRGERVACWALNRPEWVVTQLAASRAGLIFVTLNPAYRAREAADALARVGARVLVTSARHRSSDYLAMLLALAPELARARPGELRAAALPELRAVVQLGAASGAAAPGFLAWEELAARGGGAAARAALDARAAELDADEVTNVQFTSGTTGRPKGVMLSHHSLLNNGRACGEAQRLTAEDAICIPVPLYHCFGSVLGVLAALTHGAAMVLPGEGFDAGATLAAVESERCTALYGVPTMMIAALAHGELPRRDLRSLRTGIVSGAPVPLELARALVARLHMRDLTIAYGMTETAPLSFQSTPDDPLERRVASIGRVLPHVEVKVVDAATGRTLPRGQRGELWTRGYNVMRGYWQDEAATAAAITPARWMRTGDLAVIDGEGYGHIVGRIKDLVIRGGENIAPREVEEWLMTHPAVLDAQVFGVADERLGEELCAWVRLRPGAAATAAELRAHCAGSIAHFKVPRYVQLVDAFPLTTSGKPQKYIMREEAERRLGLAKAGQGQQPADGAAAG